MKKIYFLAPALLLASTSQVFAGYNTTLSQALTNGTASLDTRMFYFDRSFDKPNTPDAQALTVGGIAKYETGAFNHFSIGGAYYGSFRLFDIYDKQKGTGTSLLQSDGNDIGFLGEAYLNYKQDHNQIKIGRQRLNTPLINDHYIRFLPSTYEAAVFHNTSLKNTDLEFGYIRSYSGFGSKLNDFDDQKATWGDDGLAYFYGKTKLNKAFISGQYVSAIKQNGTIQNYRFADTDIPLKIGQKTYLKGQYLGTGYRNAKDSNVWGFKTGTTFANIDLAVAYDRIQGNDFKAVESGALYNDWQQGYGNYEPSTSVGLQVLFHPIQQGSIKLGMVRIKSDIAPNYVDSFDEYNLDAKYNINKNSQVRLRYSYKSQADESTRENRSDVRLIADYKF